MLHLIHSPIEQSEPASHSVALSVDRWRLAKRRWRGVAEDGTEFGFELETALRPGDTFWVAAGRRYVIVQEPEPVLEVALTLTPAAAAGIAWALGNQHKELSAEPTRLLTPDEPATRQLLERIAVPFIVTAAVFRPGRFVRGGSSAPIAQDLGGSHQH